MGALARRGTVTIMEQENEKFVWVSLDFIALVAAIAQAGLTLWAVSLSSPFSQGDTGVWWVTAALLVVSLSLLLPGKAANAVLFSVGNWVVAAAALFAVPADFPVRTPLWAMAVAGPVLITIFALWYFSMTARFRRLAVKQMEATKKVTETPEVHAFHPPAGLEGIASPLPAAGHSGLPVSGANHGRVDSGDEYWGSPAHVAMRIMADEVYPAGQLHHVLMAEDGDGTYATMTFDGLEFSGSPVDFLHYCGSMAEVIGAQPAEELHGLIPFGAVVKFHPAVANHHTMLVGVFEGGHYQAVVIGDERDAGEFDAITKSPEVKSTLDMLFEHTGMYSN